MEAPKVGQKFTPRVDPISHGKNGSTKEMTKRRKAIVADATKSPGEAFVVEVTTKAAAQSLASKISCAGVTTAGKRTRYTVPEGSWGHWKMGYEPVDPSDVSDDAQFVVWAIYSREQVRLPEDFT